MPADRGSESVFGDQSLLQFRGREPREIGSFLTQRQKKSRNVRGATDLAFVDVVMQPERDHSPLAEIAVEFVFPEIQLAKMFQEFGLFLGRYKRRPISEPLRKRGQRLEKTELTIKHVSLDKGGCRRCERMSDISPDELASAIVRDAVQRHIESRRRRIDSFVDRHFTFGGSVALHRRAPGWDLLRAHAVTLSSALAAMIAQQMAIAAFPFGASLGGLWYSLFPATAGPELLTATTAGVFLGGAMLAAFFGVVTDPLQRRLGLHRARLQRLLQILEADCAASPVETGLCANIMSLASSIFST